MATEIKLINTLEIDSKHIQFAHNHTYANPFNFPVPGLFFQAFLPKATCITFMYLLFQTN